MLCILDLILLGLTVSHPIKYDLFQLGIQQSHSLLSPSLSQSFTLHCLYSSLNFVTKTLTPREKHPANLLSDSIGKLDCWLKILWNEISCFVGQDSRNPD